MSPSFATFLLLSVGVLTESTYAQQSRPRNTPAIHWKDRNAQFLLDYEFRHWGINDLHPLKANMMKRGFDERFDQLDAEAYRKLYSKLNNNGTVTIGIFGGSMTDGEECVSYPPPSPNETDASRSHMSRLDLQRECAWSERLMRYLRVAYPHATIVRKGFAVSSSDSIFGLASLRQELFSSDEHALDLCIFDYSMNDSRTYNAANRDNATLLYVTESILRLTKEHHVASLYLSVFMGSDPACDNLYVDVCQQYRVPVLSYRQAVLPELASKATASVFYLAKPEHVHPPFQSHVLIAHYIAAFLTGFHQMLENLEASPSAANSTFVMPPEPLHLPASRSHSSLSGASVETPDCFPYWTEYSLLGHDNRDQSSSAHRTPSTMVGWTQKSDLPGKPEGWISDHSDISFTVAPGRGVPAQPTMTFVIKTVEGKVTITYLETYRNAGMFRVYISMTGRHSQGHFHPTSQERALANPDMIPCCNGLKTKSATLDTLNEATNSSGIASKTFHFDIAGTMEVVVEHIPLSDAERERRAGEKVKIFSVRSC